MPHGGKFRTSNKNKKYNKDRSDRSKPNQATEWSEWRWGGHGNGARWYQFRKNMYGEIEYKIHPSAEIDDDPYDKSYDEDEDEDGEARFGAPPNVSQCACGNAGCSSNSGCVGSTRFGDPDRDQRQPSESQDNAAIPILTPSFSQQMQSNDNSWNSPWGSKQDNRQPDESQYTAINIPAPSSMYQMQWDEGSFGSDTSNDDLQNHLPVATRHSTLDVSHGTVFGRICKDMGLLNEDYWEDPGKYEKPASYWNGERLQNNCVFVSVGYLLGMPSEQLSSYLQAEPLPTQLQGVNLGEIERILYRIPGLNIVAFPAQRDGSWGRRSQNPESQQIFALRKLNNYLKGNGRQFAIGYQRSNGSGHCVVAQRLGNRSGFYVKHYQYTCFQHETNGRNMSEDVRKSFICFVIFVNPDSSRRALNCFYESMPQSNGRQSAASADHVTLYDDGSSPATASSQTSTGSNYSSAIDYNASRLIPEASTSKYLGMTSYSMANYRNGRSATVNYSLPGDR